MVIPETTLDGGKAVPFAADATESDGSRTARATDERQLGVSDGETFRTNGQFSGGITFGSVQTTSEVVWFYEPYPRIEAQSPID
ncbi:hypothetical protein [Halogranum amylolyticum]|uniref:hypothetical protein n=1 Tax=Halogranum amylolyticum TaxID=660520 RepID=UPI000ABF3F1B|nr:hypothetical protein [Halogranum amylolyticum]